MKKIILTLLGVSLLGAAGASVLMLTLFRVYVPEDSCLVLTRKMGRDLPPGQTIATEPDQKGIHLEPYPPGRHFLNPYLWDHELFALTEIPAGDPTTWEWFRLPDATRGPGSRTTRFGFTGRFPKVGIVRRKFGQDPPPGTVVVSADSPYKGTLREVLTPGTYRINPRAYDVELVDAVFIPPGFVGVVTNQYDDPAIASPEAAPVRADDGNGDGEGRLERLAVLPLAQPGRRGTMRDVLEPGIYFINPKWQKVEVVEIGYHELSQVGELEEAGTVGITFQSDSGFTIDVGVTVVWGIHPDHAAETINEFGNIDTVLDKVIEPQLRSICRNVGAKYEAVDFIQGERREEYQRNIMDALKKTCAQKHIDILLVLVRNIEVIPPDTGMAGQDRADLKRTLQETRIAYESQITKEKQLAAAAMKASLEEAVKKIDVARETVSAETGVIVAQLRAEGSKKAAETTAQTDLEVAVIQEQIARLDAQRIEILGRANANVQKLKKEAEARGFQMLVAAFGGAEAYNLYTFAERFAPDSIKLFYAGEGTFWTDLSRIEDAAAAHLLQSR